MSPAAAPLRVPLLQRTAVQVALLLLAGALWGTVFSIARIGVTSGLAPLAYAFWTFTFVALIALAAKLMREGRPRLGPGHARFLLAAGLMRIAIPNLILFYALQHLAAGVAALIIATATMITYVIALAIGRERFTTMRFAGLMLGLSGVALILAPRLAGGTGEAVWVVAAFGTPLFYAIANVFIERRRPIDIDSPSVIVGLFVVSAVVTLPFALAGGGLGWPLPPSTGEVAAMAHAAVTATAFVLALELIRNAGVVFASQVSYVLTICGMFWSMWLLGERHGLALWAALGLILGGVALVSLGQRRAGGPRPS